MSLAMARSTGGQAVMCGEHLCVLRGSSWQKWCEQLAENAWENEMQRRPSYLGSSALAGTQNKTGRALGQWNGAVSQAAMILTLLWVKGHKPEKKSVYHVGNSCHP